MPPQADVVRLKQAVERADGDIDLLLTCEWPAGVTAGAAPVPDARAPHQRRPHPCGACGRHPAEVTLTLTLTLTLIQVPTLSLDAQPTRFQSALTGLLKLKQRCCEVMQGSWSTMSRCMLGSFRLANAAHSDHSLVPVA